VEFARLEALPVLGVGLLLNPHTFEVAGDVPPAYQFLEIIPDRFWLDRGPRSGMRFAELAPTVEALDALAAEVPVIAHGIGLSIGSASLFDTGYLDQVALWQKRYGFAWHSDHLAFSRLSEHGVEIHAAVTLPLTRDDESLRLLADRIAVVFERVPVPFLLENNVYFVKAPDETYSEPAFLNALCERSGCGLLLDLHNLYVNARNHAFAPEAQLDEIDLRHVVEVHVAGGDELMGVYMDSHAGPVAPAVWPLLERTLRAAPWIRAVTFEYHESYADRFGPGGVAAELRKAREIWERCR
jgi:uncharacterized protein